MRFDLAGRPSGLSHCTEAANSNRRSPSATETSRSPEDDSSSNGLVENLLGWLEARWEKSGPLGKAAIAVILWLTWRIWLPLAVLYGLWKILEWFTLGGPSDRAIPLNSEGSYHRSTSRLLTHLSREIRRITRNR